MRQHRSRCASWLRAPLAACLGLAVSLSAGLAQDMQKLAQVNPAQVVPRAGPAARALPEPGVLNRELNFLRPGEDLRRWPGLPPTETPPKKPAGAGAGPKEASEPYPTPPPTEAPLKKPALEPLPTPPPWLPSSGPSLPPLGLVGFGALGLALAVASLWLL